MLYNLRIKNFIQYQKYLRIHLHMCEKPAKKIIIIPIYISLLIHIIHVNSFFEITLIKNKMPRQFLADCLNEIFEYLDEGGEVTFRPCLLVDRLC